MNTEIPEMPLSKDSSSADSDLSLLKWGSDFLKLLWFQKYFSLKSLQIQMEFPYTTFLSQGCGKHQDKLMLINSAGRWTILSQDASAAPDCDSKE